MAEFVPPDFDVPLGIETPSACWSRSNPSATTGLDPASRDVVGCVYI